MNKESDVGDKHNVTKRYKAVIDQNDYRSVVDDYFSLLGLLKLEYFFDSGVEYNWTVTLGGAHIGILCSSGSIVSGDLGDLNNTAIFDIACDIAKEDIRTREKEKEEVFNEDVFLRDVAKVWGEAGAHSMLLQQITNMVKKLRDKYPGIYKELEEERNYEDIKEDASEYGLKEDKVDIGKAIDILDNVIRDELHSSTLSNIIKQLEEYLGSLE